MGSKPPQPRKGQQSFPFPIPSPLCRKRQGKRRCAYEKPMIKSTYKKRVKSKRVSLFLFYGLQIQFQVIFLNEVLFAHRICENEGQDCRQDEANQNQTEPVHRGNACFCAGGDIVNPTGIDTNLSDQTAGYPCGARHPHSSSCGKYRLR